METTTRLTIGLLVMMGACAALAGEAGAACAPTTTMAQLGARTRLLAHEPAAQVPGDNSDRAETRPSIVGMWNAEYLLGDGPERYDQSFQQFHDDGTEIMISNGLPPAFGNVCVGVWRTDGRTVNLRHTTWNWDEDGHLAGTFVMLVTIQVDRRGDSFRGTWSADSYDLSNNRIPDLHAEGIVRATRITVD